MLGCTLDNGLTSRMFINSNIWKLQKIIIKKGHLGLYICIFIKSLLLQVVLKVDLFAAMAKETQHRFCFREVRNMLLTKMELRLLSSVCR